MATATIRGVVARAYYSSDRAKLTHFCNIMRSGVSVGDSDMPIIMLWQFLVRASAAGKSEGIRRLRYAKTEWALDAFLTGRLPKRLCGAEQELFPLPEELSDGAVA